ncbi:ATP-dependent DNA helicase UvrD2 [Boudabousia liubingyangii]|uniref:ATP-dependent DNA helicase UvrD2 n=1 Tax=Boudabousia liubingyangii TaxID=1921764 RepID=UPI0009FB4B64|nr:ATP-dependent DNA helicase UvrD2 [Boudabousia liubingyangii]
MTDPYQPSNHSSGGAAWSDPELLVPKNPYGLDPEVLLSALDPEQAAVALQTRGPLAVLAGAGTGKTRAITYRIAYGVATGVYRPDQVLAVTFTARAASEMRTRLATLGVPSVNARTFHAAALKQLGYFWPTAIGGTIPPLINHKASLVNAAAIRLGLPVDRELVRDYAAEIEWAKVSMIEPGEYPTRAPKAGRIPPADVDYQQIAQLLSAYEDAKWDQGVIDFEDVLLLTVGMLEQRPDIAQTVRKQYRSFVVDEYQDVSALQQRLLEAWLGDRNDLCVVGDVAQTIYSFAGAKPAFLINFASRFPGARTVELVRDYRSTPQVVSLANRILELAPGGRQKGSVALKSQLPSGPSVRFETYQDDQAEAEGVLERVKKLHEQGVPYSQMAVLYRTNAQSALYEQVFAKGGVNFLVRGGEEFFKRDEVKRTINSFRTMVGALEVASTAELMKQAAQGAGWTPNPPTASGAVRERYEALNALVTLAEDREAEGIDPKAFANELGQRALSSHAPTVEGVTFATFHAAKGLEWEAVFLIGASDKLIPISLANTPEMKTEERRLLYVGVTRAKRHLQISYAKARPGGRGQRKLSPFLQGIWPSIEAPNAKTKAHSKSATNTADPRQRAKAAQAAFDEEQTPEVIERFQALKAWRKAVAEGAQKPAYVIFSDHTLRQIAVVDPKSRQSLGLISGVGEVKLARYGEQVLQCLAQLREE